MNTALSIYNALYARYGELNWWPADSPYEVMVGAVLTQNTNWSNVELALANFTELSPQFVRDCTTEELIDIIRPAGFFNQKAAYLKAVTAWFEQYDYHIPTVQRESLEKLRPELLAVKGIGKETADSILLYAFGFPTFIVDAYTVRLCARLGLELGGKYDTVKAYFEDGLPHDVALYNNYHAMIVVNHKEHCRKLRPLCDTCPLTEVCPKL